MRHRTRPHTRRPGFVVVRADIVRKNKNKKTTRAVLSEARDTAAIIHGRPRSVVVGRTRPNASYNTRRNAMLSCDVMTTTWTNRTVSTLIRETTLFARGVFFVPGKSLSSYTTEIARRVRQVKSLSPFFDEFAHTILLHFYEYEPSNVVSSSSSCY